jgi:hypothetical protein
VGGHAEQKHRHGDQTAGLAAYNNEPGRDQVNAAADAFRLADGLIIEERGLDDGVAVLQQLGVIPTGAK